MTCRGYSLPELLVVLVLAATLLAMGLPHAARWRDRFAVRAARDELAAALAWTRISAAAAGGATLVLRPDSGLFRTQTAGGQPGPARNLAGTYGVAFEAPDRPIVIPFDALGIGRVASRTVVVRRGEARAGVVVSAYGRVRAW